MTIEDELRRATPTHFQAVLNALDAVDSLGENLRQLL
jgi:hypothetical protein